MSKIANSIIDSQNLINEELDYLYHKEQELLNNISQVMELRQDLLNGIKEDLKKLADVYKVDNEVPIEVEMDICKYCSIPCKTPCCYQCKLEEDGCEVERERDDYDPTDK